VALGARIPLSVGTEMCVCVCVSRWIFSPVLCVGRFLCNGGVNIVHRLLVICIQSLSSSSASASKVITLVVSNQQ
jgi:hypothetical protein